MEALTLTGQLNFLCWLIFTVKHVASQPSINFVETAALQRPPYQLDDSYLQLMSPKERRNLCRQMFEEIQSTLSSVTPHNEPEYMEFPYVPKAHMYKFDDHEEWLSIRCASMPPFYVSHETTEQINHHWHVRIVKPAIESYEFRLETFVDVTGDFPDEQTGTHLPPKTHYFYKLDTLKRWHLCSEARHMIDYPIETMNCQVYERPRIHTFEFLNNQWTEEYLAFKCAGEPEIYLRTGDSKNETNVIWIALLEQDEDDDDDDDEDDSETDSDVSADCKMT